MEVHSIKAAFPKPIKLGEEVHLILKNEDNNLLKIKLLCGEAIVTKIKVKLNKSIQREFDCIESCHPEKFQPHNMLAEEIKASSGSLNLFLNIESATKLFPILTKRFSPLQLAVIMSSTRLVGAVCLGLH